MCCSVNGYVCLVCCVSDSVCELFWETIRNIFGSGCYFVVECYGSVECRWRLDVLCWIDVWSSRECVCVPSVHLDAYAIGLFVYVGIYSSFKSRITGVCSPHVVLCVIFHTMWSGKSLQLLCILPFGIICLSAIRMIFVKIILAVCIFIGIVV